MEKKPNSSIPRCSILLLLGPKLKLFLCLVSSNKFFKLLEPNYTNVFFHKNTYLMIGLTNKRRNELLVSYSKVLVHQLPFF